MLKIKERYQQRAQRVGAGDMWENEDGRTDYKGGE